MIEGNDTAVRDPFQQEILSPYIECPDCRGRGIVRARVDAETRLSSKDPSQYTVWREHDRCNGGGILILRMPSRKGASPYYGAPKLS